ncbi:hypothetical protein GCM10010831_18300 [Psychroflexus salis]|uniref:Uncharacterized protein n=1 Tax=Psychroflexus salis TaxID=1526574 RepID=A0A917EAZ4_9FLAO|nr:hypothetical protein GCM10010831_18300 [Psychroflexus salis]
MKYILTNVDKGELSIEIAKKINLKPSKKIQIQVPFSEITTIEKSGLRIVFLKKTQFQLKS